MRNQTFGTMKEYYSTKFVIITCNCYIEEKDCVYNTPYSLHLDGFF